jgi:hypothetical protein
MKPDHLGEPSTPIDAFLLENQGLTQILQWNHDTRSGVFTKMAYTKQVRENHEKRESHEMPSGERRENEVK